MLGVLGSAPDTFGLSGFLVRTTAADAVRAQEWWLGGLQAARAWQGTEGVEGAGVTVAVLGTGVAGGHPDLSGSVIAGPDYTGSGRVTGGPFWGISGTAVAAVIAGHGHGAGGGSGVTGIAPKARILSIRVTLEFNDPLVSDQAIARRLPDAIAAGIRYAADHGARVIDLPLDPGTLGLTGSGDPPAAGGSTAERAAVAYALGKNVVLVAPAGDDGQGPGIVNYPAAYPGVIAVGATGRTGQLALFSSRQPYASLTAPGADMVAATPAGGYSQISTTGMASGLVAGVAALLVARFPHLSTAQVTQALTESTVVTAAAGPGAGSSGGTATTGTAGTADGAGLPPLPARSAHGAGYGTVNAARAVALAALISSPAKPAPSTSAAPSATPTGPARPAAASPAKTPGSTLAGSLVKFVVAGLAGLIALLTGLLVLMRSRRARGGPPGTARGRNRGQHEHRRPAAASVPGHAAAEPGPPGTVPPGTDPAGTGSPSASGPPAQVGWQGGSLGEISTTGSFRPAIAPVSRSSSGRPGRRGSSGGAAGPPWEPAPAPERMPGPLPVVSRSAFPQSSGTGIRVPRDMPLPEAPPATFDPPASPFDSPGPPFDPPGTPFAPPGPPFDLPGPPFDSPGPPFGPPGMAADFPTRPDLPTATDLPTRQSLGFAAAPVATDYDAPPAAPTDHAVPPLPADITVHHEPHQGPISARPTVPDFTAPPPVPGPGASPSMPGLGASPPMPGPGASPGTGAMADAEPSGPPTIPGFPALPDPAGFPAEADLTHPGPSSAISPAASPEAGPEASPVAGRATPGSGQPAGNGYLWDLAATDVFPVADSATPPPAPGAVPPQEAPGASGG